MSGMESTRLREAVSDILAARGMNADVGEHEPLFSSGLLDSLSAAELLMFLESEYGVDLADEDFDITQIDTLHALEALVSAQRGQVEAAE